MSCLFCGTDVREGTNKKKRKLLFGQSQSSADALDVLNTLSLMHYNKEFSEMKPSSTEEVWSCHKCITRMLELPGLLQKVADLQNDILGFINHSHLMPAEAAAPSLTVSPQPSSEVVSSPSTPTGSCFGKRRRCDVPVEVSVNIDFPSCKRRVNVTSPWSSTNVRRILNKSYTALTSSITTSNRTYNGTIISISRAIRKELKNACSVEHSSILMDDVEALMHFNWETIWSEIKNMMPTLVKVLVGILSDSNQSRKIICVITCILLKNSFPKMSLMQRAISILLYANGCTKKIFTCLQPLMLSLSHSGTLKVINKISEDHDIDVLYWSDNLLHHLKERSMQQTKQRAQYPSYENHIALPEDDMDEDSLYDNENSTTTFVAVDDIDDEKEEMCASTMIPEISDEDVINAIERIDNDEEEHEIEILNEHQWRGFKIVGDNVDKNFRRSFQRVAYSTRSFHYFHSYAVLDRVDYSSLPDHPRGEIITKDLLPTASEIIKIKEIFSTLVSRILLKHFPQFHSEKKSVTWHIQHDRSREMKKKSTIVPLGIQPHNENKVDEMCLILEKLHRYVPKIDAMESTTLPNGEIRSHKRVDMWEVLLGGDQLTAARVRGAKCIRINSHDDLSRLKGVHPMVEDWHIRMTLMKVIWRRLFNKESFADKGTLYQIKNLINRTSVPKDPEDDMNAAEDFFEDVLECYVVVAAEVVLENESEKSFTLISLSQEVVNKFVRLLPCEIPKVKDQVFNYSCEVLTLGLIWYNYLDATREGDGGRVMDIWKFLMII